jgi:hypothetical protein
MLQQTKGIVAMAKYDKCKNWHEFEQEVTLKFNNPKRTMTDFFNYCLLHGNSEDGVNGIHEKVKKEQNGKRYIKLGCLYINGKPDPGTFFGHIATCLDWSCEIKFGELMLDGSVSEERLHEKYKNNEFLRIEGFKGERRPDKASDISGNKMFSSCEYLPAKGDVEKAHKKLSSTGDYVEIEVLLDQVEKDCLDQGHELKSNWRLITERNIDIWSCS